MRLDILGRMELLQVGAWRDDHHLFRCVTVVELVLIFDLVSGAGNHQTGVGKDVFFSINPLGKMIMFLNVVCGQAHGEQSLVLVTAERMAGVDQGQACHPGEPNTNISSIGIMAVQKIRPSGLFLHPIEKIVCKAIKMIP